MDSKYVIDILFKAIEKDYESLETSSEDSIDPKTGEYKPVSFVSGCIMDFEKYRLARIEETYTAKELRRMGLAGTRQSQMELSRLDKQRRYSHDSALASVNILNKLMKSYDLPQLYNGPTLTEEEFRKHSNPEKIKQYTDFFFELLVIVGDMSRAKLREKENQNDEITKFSAKELGAITKHIQGTTRGYGLTKPILHDNDRIEFDDDER